MPEKLLAYLGSSKNLVGCVLFAVGLVLFALGVTGAYGLLVAGILYAVGALLTPHPKVHLSLPVRDTEEVAALRRDLDALRRKVGRAGSRLPSSARQRTDRILSLLETILSSADQLTTSQEQMFVVSRTIRDYLPTSLEVYLNLPSSFALTGVGGKRSALEELCSQLDLLERQMGKVATSLYEGNAQALVNQGRFLEERFHASSLDLPS